MIEHSLSNLFLRMSAQSRTGAADLMDAETLVAASAGTLSGDRRDEVAGRLSRSSLQTDLVRMLRDLSPASELLANAVGERGVVAHPRSGRNVRHAAVLRRHAKQLPWIGLAAGLMLVFGLVSWQPPIGDESMATHLQAPTKPDRIFTSVDRIFSMNDGPGARSGADDLFESDFNDG